MMEKAATIKYNKYNRTPMGLVSKWIRSQRNTYRQRESRAGMYPNYSLQELRAWALEQPKFMELFDKWVESGYNRDLVPSVDRKDPTKGYTLDNIQLMTWRENREKGRYERMDLVRRPVKQLNLDGSYVRTHDSVTEAAAFINRHHMGISDTCNGKQATCGGYKCAYA